MSVPLLDGLLKEAIDSVKSTDMPLTYKISEAAETENISTIVEVRFEASAYEGSLSLSQLIEQLKKSTTVGSVDIFGPPANQVVIFGAVRGKSYKIIIQL